MVSGRAKPLGVPISSVLFSWQCNMAQSTPLRLESPNRGEGGLYQNLENMFESTLECMQTF